ncbi:hypothetical protein HO173_006998 [Letharia columbiana]|uniref:N-acetyltransferase domain-containing protein n=1 Tax=Letharia columbiana TaxID=112416 RepID=A0A8H6L426_9LECA|nr:uncharacterized protein HO173_006998 [Letharia columbiana]KAF6234778.1 hypothetical protein HO173_006998 [Letharia columbiana]
MARIRRSNHSIEHQSTKGHSTESETIKTLRLQLREARKSDLADFHEMLSSGDVMRYWAWPTHTSIDETKSYLNDMIASTTNGDMEFAIVLPAPMPVDRFSTAVSKDKVIGTAGIWDEATGEIELMLHRDSWGQGYMSEVLTTLIPRFWQKGLQKVIADVDPRNKGSIKLLNRFGFVETRREKNTFETDIGWCDSVFLELWRPERGV